MNKYKLIWSDEFDYEGMPDPTKWIFDIGGHGGGNKEAQYYTNDLRNCIVKDGKLIITALREQKEKMHYTSAKICSKFAFQYGRLEVKAKIPRGRGTWPAIWLLGNNFRHGTSWPMCGEIDLMEHTGKQPNEIIFSLHTDAYNHRLNNHRTFVKRVENVFDQFVEYALEWTQDYIEFFINRTSVVRFLRNNDICDKCWPFNQKYYLIINLAIGGTLGGEIDDNIFPVNFEIDYVRIYEMQKQENF